MTHLIPMLLAVVALLSGCAPQGGADQAAGGKRGELIAFTLLETRDRATLQAVADALPGRFQVKDGADFYRIAYWTELKGRPVRASGLVVVPPAARAPRGVVLYLHGTMTTRALSPSRPDRADGDQEAAVFAGAGGYLVALPDYVGLGESEGPQAYVVTRPQVDASIDMLKALRPFAAQRGLRWSPDLFLAGFSQGGQTAAGLHRALERAPLEDYALKATAAIAGPHDLRAALLSKLEPPAALEPNSIGYVAFAVSAYAAYYDAPLDEAMTPEAAGRVPGLFDGAHWPDEIGRALPGDARRLFRPAFLRALESREGNWFTRALDENQTWAWVPQAPLRIVVGEADRDVPPASSRALYDYAKARGGAVELRSMGAVDHMTAAAMSYAPTLEWFEGLSADGR